MVLGKIGADAFTDLQHETGVRYEGNFKGFTLQKEIIAVIFQKISKFAIVFVWLIFENLGDEQDLLGHDVKL